MTRIISPSSSLDSFCVLRTGHIPSASLCSGGNLSGCPLQQHHGSIQAVWLHTSIFTAKAAVHSHASHSLHALSYCSTKPFNHHTVSGPSHNSDWPEKRTNQHISFSGYHKLVGCTTKPWEEMIVSGSFDFFLFYYFFFINCKNSCGIIRIRKHLSVLCRCGLLTYSEVSLGTAFLLVTLYTEKYYGRRRKTLIAQRHCKDCWKEPSAHWSPASSLVSLQQAPFAAFFPHPDWTLINLLYLAPGRFCLFHGIFFLTEPNR